MRIFQPTVSGSFVESGSMIVSGSITSTQGSIVTGSINLSGSVVSNVVPISIVSSTASVDFRNAGCFFTLTLPANATTHISASSTSPGLSTILVIKTDTNSQVSFNSIFKQPSGAQYTASLSGSTDVLSFITVDNSNIYAISSLKMI